MKGTDSYGPETWSGTELRKAAVGQALRCSKPPIRRTSFALGDIRGVDAEIYPCDCLAAFRSSFQTTLITGFGIFH